MLTFSPDYFINKKKLRQKIVAISLSTAPIAKIADPLVDIVLVGDSLAMTIFNLASTQSITLDTMIRHGSAVTSVCSHAAVVIDMPYESYLDPERALNNARNLLEKTNAHAVKIEGGVEVQHVIEHLVRNNIHVCGHIGLLPQSVQAGQPYRHKGREENAHEHLLADALALQEAGAFAIVFEAMLEHISADISQKIFIPSIGIGASPLCDGQILVAEDIIGLSLHERLPRFVKQYTHVHQSISLAIKAYAEDVQNQKFPTLDHCYLDKKHKER